MKMQNLAVIIATVALVLAVWSAREYNALQARIDSLAGVLRGQADRGANAISGESLEDRLKKLEAVTPGLGEIMSGIQMHAAKLYFAGQATNWPLVEFEMGEIDEALATVPLVRPQENNVPLAPVIEAFRNTQWTALKDVVSRKDAVGFGKAYHDVVLVCNICHQATAHPYIQIIPPAQPPVPNQRWEPGPAGR